MNRDRAIARLLNESFDILVIGGGASGLGCALEAASRGYRTALVEAADFAGATSSRSTKLIHGGVRYLRQGNIALVREALLERSRLLDNAPEIVHERQFIIPAYGFFDLAYYSAGLKAYDALASGSFTRSRLLSPRTAAALMPALRTQNLRAVVSYADAQFDDARLALAIARTAVDHGAAVANYVRADGLLAQQNRICGATCVDEERGERFTVSAQCVINAAGIFADEIRRFADPDALPLLRFSRGTHIVLPSCVVGESGTALLVPKTGDGRVLFAIPWHEATLVGTTDIPEAQAQREPRATDEEIAYLLQTLGAYLRRRIDESDVRSAWAGLRPLLRRDSQRDTARLSREHAIEVSAGGLVSVLGGKWTTYRKMAQDAVDASTHAAGLAPSPSITANLRLHCYEPPLLATLDERVRFAAEQEQARTVEDVLARRTRALFLDAKAARDQAPAVAAALARTLQRDRSWEIEQLRDFNRLASAYRGMA